MPTEPDSQFELYSHHRSFSEWCDWSKSNPCVFDHAYSRQLIDRIVRHGLANPLAGQALTWPSVEILHGNYRETLRAGRLISRHRALLLELRHLARDHMPLLLDRLCRIYATEAITDFALFMRGRYPKYLGSEYAETAAERAALFPIKSEDLTALSFPSSVFDLVITNDVLEHVPDIDASLIEVFRLLKEPGVFLATFPFAYGQHEGIVRAKRDGEKIDHLLEPEYHGNPMQPDKGSLVFETPGWNIVERTKASGFTDAYFSFISSARYGVAGQVINGLFVFVACKGFHVLDDPLTTVLMLPT